MQSIKDKKENRAIPNVERDNWNVKDLADEAANQSSDEILRQTLRGGAAQKKADERDVAGGADKNETPQGREEAKKNSGDA
ncbi:MAG: hypothetical protein ACR2HG_09635 [Pyrinomonadaceae bacterium]